MELNKELLSKAKEAKTPEELLNDEALETVSGGRRLEISLDLNKKSDLQDPGRKK